MNGERVRVLMQTQPRVPFGADWARAASRVAAVETFRFSSGPVNAPAESPRAASPGDAGVPHRIPARKLRGERFLARVADRRRARAFVALVRDIEARSGKVDLVHAHFYSGARALPAACAELGIPYVVTEHSTRLTGRSADHKPFTRANRRAAVRVYAAAARVLAVSAYLRDCMIESGVAASVEVVHNPVELPRTEAVPEPDVEQVVSVGRLEADKDPLLLLDAFALVAADRPATRLVLLGDGPLRGEVAKRAAQPDLLGRVQIRGRVPRTEVAAELARSQCFAMASTVETFCMAAAEAVLAGVPVVMPRQGPIGEVVGGYGVLVEGRGPEAFAAAIRHCLEAGPGAWPDDIRRDAIERFSPATIAEQLKSVYTAAVARHPNIPGR